VQAGAARITLGGEPDLACAALAEVSAAGRTGLSELRRILGVIGGEDHDSPEPPFGVAGIVALAERRRAGGWAWSPDAALRLGLDAGHAVGDAGGGDEPDRAVQVVGDKHTQAVLALSRRRVSVLWAMLRDDQPCQRKLVQDLDMLITQNYVEPYPFAQVPLAQLTGQRLTVHYRSRSRAAKTTAKAIPGRVGHVWRTWTARSLMTMGQQRARSCHYDAR
jgi:hypothetical protein